MELVLQSGQHKRKWMQSSCQAKGVLLPLNTPTNQCLGRARRLLSARKLQS